MTTKQARDFLDKQLFVNHDIVTFRSLSRELGIHVNDAKSELQHYYDAVRDTDTPAVPTYLVSGEVPALMVPPHSMSQHSESSMDLDLEFDEDRVAGEEVVQTNVLLVHARALDETMAQFTRVHAVHIYSLSPSQFGDAGLVCTPSAKVQHADAKGGPKFFAVVGKITGSHVKLRSGAVTGQGAASSSKMTLDAPPKVFPKLAAPPNAEQRSIKGKAAAPETNKQDSMLNSEPKDRPKISGKLDWSRAKTKEKVSTEEEKKPKREPDTLVATGGSLASKKPGREPTKPSIFKSKASDPEKRGIKRKPIVGDESESESEAISARIKPSKTAGPSVKKEVIDSDEDEDGAVRMLGLRRLRRKSTVTSDSEMSLRAMMDIDDDRVDRVPRASKILPQREEEEESEEGEDIPEKETTAPPVTTEDESDHMPVIQKKRKPRKVVPVGRNGVKKRRVVKSRTTTDAKGYMQTEDYSSYESVEEDEEETKPKGKGKGLEKNKVAGPDEKVKPKVEESAGKPKAKSAPKPRGGASKRGGLLNFFGPERGKK